MIRVAVLGAGIGAEHLHAYKALPEAFQVVWVIDQNAPRAEALRQGESFAVSDRIGDALHDPSVDVIDICLPPHLHVATTLAALAAGKHVICEKPLATCLADVAKIIAASQASGKTVYPVFQYRWGRACAQLRHLIATGATGRPDAASVTTHWSRDASYYAVPWRGTWAGEQGGAVLGHAIHNHDLVTSFMGPVAAVSAFTTTRVNDIETEDCAAICFETTGGAVITSSITLGAAGNSSQFRLVFEHLTAVSGLEPYAPGAADWTFTARDPARQQDIDRLVASAPAEKTGFEGFLNAIAVDLNGGQSVAVTLKEGAASIELVTAIYHAARSGARVHLPLPSDHPLYNGWQP